MEITRDGKSWGTMEILENGAQVQFHATGALPQYGEILRVWGTREGCQPLLIGVAEPEGTGLTVNRTMSKQYLASLGYDALPEQYIAGVQPPKRKPQTHGDPLIEQASRQKGITVVRQADVLSLSCPFAVDAAFPLAFIFSCCTVRDGTATVRWDSKKGCPCVDSPE